MKTTGSSAENSKPKPPGPLARGSRRLTRYIGSVRFAVPALALAAVSMVWGTWIESTQGRVAAAEAVYGSIWFVALMALICASLVISVALRYPWKPKHTGFIIVHASLISLIIIGFYTMRTKIEARVILEEGESSSIAILDDRWVELLDPPVRVAGRPLRHVLAGTKPIEFENIDGLGDVRIDVLDHWANSEEVTRVTNDGTNPFHAIEIAGGGGAWEAEGGDWLGQIAAEEAAIPSDAAGFAVRVVATGETWSPPTEPARLVLVDASGTAHEVGEAGTAVGDTGWTVTGVERLARATIGQSGLIDRPDGAANPAARVVLTHTDGSVEQQTGFEKFRDAPFVQQQSGDTASGLTLTYRGASFTDPTLAIMRDESGGMQAVLADPDGSVETFEHNGTWPWRFTVSGTPVSILQSFDRARASLVRVEAPNQDSVTPVLLVATDDGEAQLVWNTPQPVRVGGHELVLNFGPVQVQLPFSLRLADFRKLDYPGVDMAMAFESDVMVTPLARSADGGSLTRAAEPFEFKIHMNHPYKQDGWKVYQSSFLGDSVSVFQVTHDPGLVPTYVACTTLCIGILLIFYSRKLSFGHPGIPAPFAASGSRTK
ncbi:MAG: cytochrome c biogenesis protein ResB [Phycisphaerales bacterium JB041]